MKKGTKKGQVERRKHPRRSSKPAAKASAQTESKSESTKPRKTARGATRGTAAADAERPGFGVADLRDMSALSLSQEHCVACGKGLKGEDRALFVEEDVGRVFCSEECITQYFQPEIDQIEKTYFKFRPKDDLSPEEREQFAHLRWITIQEPDEVWQEKRASGDKRHTLISQFKPGAKPIWCVCVCLFLRGEPSFLYMAFPTKSKALVDKFRKGVKIDLEKEQEARAAADAVADAMEEDLRVDGLASDWTQSETLQAEIHQTRDSNDIPEEEYALYEPLLEKTLESPDELWVLSSKDDGVPDRYHFMKHFPDEEGGPMYYIVVAQESEQTEHLEVLEQIPTRDERNLKRFRRGRQETLVDDEKMSKTVH